MATKETFTDNKRVKDLIKLMSDHGLTEIELVEDKAKIRLKRDYFPAGGPSPAIPNPLPIPLSPLTPAGAPPAAPAAEENLTAIKSPMVGTFYTAANPDSEPFVKIGSNVDKDTVVCIIEAMKVFNEIRAEISGVVAKVMVRNGEPVEYNQPLFLVKAG
ncbi:MAG: acetyl-CoA carboxylase biotin carboxyl carrier protein [Planctomycetia bacterium]|nr:acetyl-CoA carboxylase biotin carboxyl carrier protein [Planctomycetia bacterium]